jgi:Ricin-type beta-trefoil lectin domain
VIAKCLTAFGSADGTPVTLIACQDVLHGLQKWIYIYPGQIVNVGLGKCLTVEDPIDGLHMTVRTCDTNNGNQYWSLRS